ARRQPHERDRHRYGAGPGRRVALRPDLGGRPGRPPFFAPRERGARSVLRSETAESARQRSLRLVFPCHDILLSRNLSSEEGGNRPSLSRKGDRVEPMKETHLSVETMARWLARDLDHEEVLARVVPHLLAACPSCRASYEEVLRLKQEFEHWDERVAVLE